MTDRNFMQLVDARFDANKFVCVGLDPKIDRMPTPIRKAFGLDLKKVSLARKAKAFEEFCKQIVLATHDAVHAYKPNIAFFEALGWRGVRALENVVAFIGEVAPFVPVILDAKRADIGSTNEAYVASIFDSYGVDAVTVSPYLGGQTLKPFLDRKEKGIIVLCKTSNPGADEFQDLPTYPFIWKTFLALVNRLGFDRFGMEKLACLHHRVARNVAEHWNENGNCALVTGATCPDDIAAIRKIVGDMLLLIPGIGAQGGDLEKTVRAAVNSRGRGFLINSSRGIIYKSSGEDFAEAARAEVIRLNANIIRIRNSAMAA